MSSSPVPLRLATEPVVCATLEDFAREGARRALQKAIEEEVAAYVDAHREHRDESGHRLVVRNGHKPTRTIRSGVGPIEVTPPINVASAPVKEVENIPTVTKSTDSETTPAGYAVPMTGGKEEMVHRRSYSDITAKPCFAHAPDYTWVQGELVHLHGRNVWRIRYASVDEEDKYGGGINLIEAGPMDNFQDGQLVRIEGRPADPDNKESEYRVNSIHALPNQ